MNDLKVIFMGTPDFSVPILEYLIKNVNVMLVVTRKDKEVGRGKILSETPIKKVALENNVNVLTPDKLKDIVPTLRNLSPDLIITCAYGKILPKEVLDIPKLGCVNVHASLLPKYRGSSPMQAALLNGDEKSGVTLMYMDEEMDTGDIIDELEIPIFEDDNIESLHDKLSLLGVKILEKNLLDIKNKTNKKVPQDNSKATYTHLLKREDELLDFNQKGKDIINKIRAFNPYPGCYFILNDNEIKVIKARFIQKNGSTPKKVTCTKNEMFIGCTDGNIEILCVKPVGKKAMEIKDYLNGLKKENELYVK